MMPQLAVIRVDDLRGKRIRMWIPVLPGLVVLSPVLLLVALGAAVTCLVFRVNPVRALYVSWQVLWSLGGTRIEIDQSHARVLVNLR